MDLRQINYPDHSFDVIYCSHVLEHIVEDNLAILDIEESLEESAGGLSFQVPIYGEKTFEGFNITEPSIREKLFGQHDHVRKYGLDFLQRIYKKEDFYGKYYRITDFLSPTEAKCHGLKVGNSVTGEFGFLCI